MEELRLFLIQYRYVIEVMTVVVTIVIAISSLDDLFVDVAYWFLKFTGRSESEERARAADMALLESIPERPFAIMVPAWHEHNVIFSMLASNSRLQRYKNYHYFVGVYQNDEPTREEVMRAQKNYPNVHLVMVPRDGPTSKADCLNEITAAIFLYEAKNKTVFVGLAMHDAEDLIHPHELKLFNSLIDEYDFIQLPVFSFTCSLNNLIGGVYMDDFAEVHTKDLTVREKMGAVIPCAGVSACFSRQAIAILADLNMGEAFRRSSFTEDYDISFRVHEIGLRTTFVPYAAGYSIDISEDTGRPYVMRDDLPIATREFFPSDLGGASRQRARWFIGIVFQGAIELGWRGSLATRYFLLRDRKGIVAACTVMFGYLMLANLVAIELFTRYTGSGQVPDYGLLATPPMMTLLVANLLFLIWRVGHRVLFTTMIYDWHHGLMAGPRLIVASVLNFFASARAINIYLAHRLLRRPLRWDKTRHAYPFQLGLEVLAAAQTTPPGE